MEPLSDPLKDRVITQVQPPPHRPITKELLFPKYPDIPHWKNLQTHLTNGGLISKKDVLTILRTVQIIFKQESSLLTLQDPVVIVGDLHGQFYDLIQILMTGGSPEETQYLFLGDFVDRGSFSVECLLLAYSLKINFKKTIHILRGNHESREMTMNFNFRKEVLCKYDQEVYETIMEVFDSIPLAAIINKTIFACHGGLSPELKLVKKIEEIKREREPPHEGAFCDLLWADPYPKEKIKQHIQFQENTVRGCSYIFGNDAVNQFFSVNNLTMIIRGHEVQQEGFKAYYWQKQDSPSVITIFSAPNYCDVYNNLGAIISLKNGEIKIIQINYQPHPYILPDFLDVFSWSAVFIAEQVCHIFKSILSNADKGEKYSEQDYIKKIMEEEKKANSKEIVENLKSEQMDSEKLRKQAQFMQKLMARQEKERRQNEQLIKMNGGCIDDKLPRNEIMQKLSQNKKANFNLALEYDVKNEKRPTF